MKSQAQRRRKNKGNDRQRAAYAAYLLYRGQCCEVCGITGPGAIFDFHHVDPSNKLLGVNACWVFSKSPQEGAKCTLMCSNCHRNEHAALYLGVSTLPDGYTTPDGSTVVIPSHHHRSRSKPKCSQQSSQLSLLTPLES